MERFDWDQSAVHDPERGEPVPEFEFDQTVSSFTLQPQWAHHPLNFLSFEIMPAGAKVLPFRSNIPAISKFVFSPIDETYYDRAMACRSQGSFVVAGANYGQGSSREHAALAPRYLGLKAVVAKSFARIHLQNLSNFGILPLLFSDPDDWERIAQGDVLSIPEIRDFIHSGNRVKVINRTKGETYETEHRMTQRQVEMLLAGGLINWVRASQRHTLSLSPQTGWSP